MTEICSLLSLVGYSRCFVENFSRIAASLIRLTRKDIKFEWDDSCESAFMELKQRLTSARVLIVLNNQDPYVMYNNISGTNLG